MILRPRAKRFERVKAELTGAILAGQIAPGERLPPVRELCDHFQVSMVTILRAIQELEDEEWLVASARKGVMVADPLPPVAHLMRLKSLRRAAADPSPDTAPSHSGSGQNGVLTCLIYDEALLPAFEWAAREYADAYAPYALRFEVQSLRGRDDAESVRALDADLVLLPSYAVSRAVGAGAVTPVEGMLSRTDNRFGDIPSEVLDLATFEGRLWALPVMMAGPVLVAGHEICRRFGINWTALTSVDGVIDAVEGAAARFPQGDDDARFLNLAFLLPLVISDGHTFPGICGVPEMIEQPEVRALLERMRTLARHPRVALTRFDRWEAVDFAKVAVRHQPSSLFCRDPQNRANASVLPVPGPQGGRAVMTAHCICVSARSVHPFEAWEWAAHLGEAAFQTRLAETAYDIPASLNPQVRRAFGQAVGPENGSALQELIRRPSRLYAIAREDAMRYLWEVAGNEAYRFVAGLNDYERLIERVRTKTERFMRRSEPMEEAPVAADATETPVDEPRAHRAAAPQAQEV